MTAAGGGKERDGGHQDRSRTRTGGRQRQEGAIARCAGAAHCSTTAHGFSWSVRPLRHRSLASWCAGHGYQPPLVMVAVALLVPMAALLEAVDKLRVKVSLASGPVADPTGTFTEAVLTPGPKVTFVAGSAV